MKTRQSRLVSTRGCVVFTSVAALAAAACGGPRVHAVTVDRMLYSAAAMPSRCLVADTSAPPRDTLVVVGLEGPEPASDCQGRPIVGPRPVLVVVAPPPATDLRDVLDRGLPGQSGRRPDVVITRDPDIAAYAARSSYYFATALPWDRTYVLLGSGADSTATPAAAERDALARDAVRGEARAAADLLRASTGGFCPARNESGVVGYDANDVVAQQLAERIVALASNPARPTWIPMQVTRVAAIATDSMATAVSTGRASAIVVAYGPRQVATCALPLVETRAHALIRRGSGAAFIIGADGGISFTRRREP